MKKYYISSLKGDTVLSRYSNDFYELVLRDKGYIFMDIAESLTDILSAVSSRDLVHIEIGTQKKEVELLFLMLKAKYKYVSITLHDPPIIPVPMYEWKNPLLRTFARVYDRYIRRSGSAGHYIRRIRSIYVLSGENIEPIKKKYGIENVFYLPYIIDPREIEKQNEINTNFICFNPSGSKKEIAYCRELHRCLVRQDPSVNVYVADVLTGLKKGKIVFTSTGTAMPEYTRDGKSGFCLSGSLKEDTKTIRRIISDPALLEQVRKETYSYLIEHHSADEVRKQFKD
jgi:hypothetical protein